MLYGFSHYDQGRLFCLDPKTGEVLWQGPGRTGENVMFLSIPGHVVALVSDGELKIIAATGDRFETYVIPGKAGSGSVELNGATARLGQAGDRVIIFAFARIPESQASAFSPRIVQLDENNRVIRRNFADAA